MSRTIGAPKHVRFLEDRQPVNEDYYTYTSKAEIMPSKQLEGPSFPNMQAFFNRKNAYEEYEYDSRVEEEKKLSSHVFVEHVKEQKKISSPAFNENVVQTDEIVQSIGFHPKKHVKEAKHHNYEENIDLEATEFIKKKHRYLEMEKQMSMKM